MTPNKLGMLMIGGSLLALSCATQAYAQEQEATVESQAGQERAAVETQTVQQAGPQSEAGADRVVVTGSRLQTGLDTPTPVTFSSAEQLEVTSPGLISEAVNQLPMFKGSSRSSTGTQSSSRDNGASFLNLRGLGKERTLVLLDGRRFVSSSVSGVPDVNLFPQDLIERVEIVTGGASAAYGSDAVAGVVNFILDTDYEGLKANIRGGLSQENDNGMFQGTLTAGASFADGRGHILVSVDAFQQEGIKWDARDWNNGWALANNSVPSPRLIIASPYNFTVAPGGVITTTSLTGIQFLPGGATAPFDFGTNRTATNQVGGDGNRYPYDLTAGIDRKVAYARAQYEVGPVTLFAEGTVGQVVADYDLQYGNYFGGTAYTIFNDNAFLPAAVRTQMATEGITSFRMARVNRDWGFMVSENTSTTWRGTAGFGWEIGGGWNLDGYYMRGENSFVSLLLNDPITRNAIAAADAVVDPATGNIVCRSTLQGFDPGCVPMNLFGEGSPSQASINWATGTARADLTLDQEILSVALSGSPFALPAGPVNIAAGLEYRQETTVQTGDAISRRVDNAAGLRGAINRLRSGVPGGFQLANPQPLNGSYDVREVFLEADAPLLQDLPIVKSLSINGAIRLVDYSTVGEVTTWKAGLSYEPFEDLRFRITRSRDIRAGNSQELFTTNQTALAVINLPANVATPLGLPTGANSALGLRRGNPNLDPEIADTATYGVVYRPSWLEGFGISLDYFSIDVEGAIQQLTNQQTIDQCSNGSTIACNQLAVTSGLLTIGTPYLNLANLKTSGVDLELNYERDLGPGQLSVRGLVSYLDSLETTVPGAAAVERAGDVGVTGTPHFSGSLLVGYNQGPLGVFLQERFVGSGKIDNTLPPGSLANDEVDPVFYTDLTVKYLFERDDGPDIELFGTVNNLFDKDPPIVPNPAFGVSRSTNPLLYDVVGRYLTVGARIEF